MASTQRRSWLVVAVLLLISVVVLPPGVAVVGAVLGGVTSLLAVGLVLAYRAHRFINVAHASLGAVAGSFVGYLVAHAGWSFWLAYPVGLATGGLLGVATGMFLGERLADASRTVVLAGSLALAFIFGAAHVALGLTTGSVLAFEVPIPMALDVFPVRLSGTHLFAAVTVPVALVGVWFFLQRSDVGLRVRALAGNARHARRIGVDPHSTWRRLWLILGALAAAAGVVALPLQGTTVASGPLLGPLLLALAAASVGGMRDLPLTIGACVALGVAYQAIIWRAPVAAAADVALLAVIVIAFGLRHRAGRLDERHDPAHHRLIRSPRPLADRYRRIVTTGRIVAACAFLLAAALVLPRVDAGDAQRIGAIGVFVLAGLCVHVVATYRGSLTFGAWALVGVGATVASSVGGASLFAVVVGIAAAGGASVVLALCAARGGATAHSAVTLAAAFAFAGLVSRLPVGVVAATRFGPIALDDHATVATIVVGSALTVALGVGVLRRSSLGRNALAVREDPRLAVVHGVRVWQTRLAVDAIAGCIAGLAGVLYLWNQRVVHPDAFEATRSLELVAMTVTGGIGSAVGPFIGAAVVKGSELFASGPLHLLATGTGLFVVVLWLRGGLVSSVDVARRRWAGRQPASKRARQRPAEPTPRFCPAPSAETRKARHDPTVRHMATIAVLAGAATGVALSVVASRREPSIVVWIVVAILTVAAGMAFVGYARPRLMLPAVATVLTSVVALVWEPGMVGVPITAAWLFGVALRSAADALPQALAHASRGWVTAQAVVGGVAGGVLLASDRSDVWLVAISFGALVVATTGAPRPADRRIPARVGRSVLTVEALAVDVGGTHVLRGVDLRVASGEIVGIVGSNGVGKTTLLRAIAGEAHVGDGCIFVRHTDVTVLSPEERYELGMMLSDADNGSNGELTVGENLRLAVLSAHPASAADDAINAVVKLHARLEDRSGDRTAVLSGGERRLLALAQIAAAQPSVLLVDELARGLASRELEIYRSLLRSLADRGTAILVVDHDVDRVRHLADRVLRLHDGALTEAPVPLQVSDRNLVKTPW